MSETLSQLIRNTKEYSDVCDMCKDEILIYPIISGRKEYTQDEVEQITLKRIIDKLQAKEQECENLKAEEKYLKQCCQKAGEELAKHSFEYDGKEKNLVVQAIELNEKYEKLKKALEEIEEVIDSIFDRCLWRKTDSCMPVYNVCEELIKTLDIINKTKGETDERNSKL